MCSSQMARTKTTGQRDSLHEFKVSSLQISSTVYSASRNDFLDNLTHDVNKEEHENEHEEEHEEEYEVDHEEEREEHEEEREEHEEEREEHEEEREEHEEHEEEHEEHEEEREKHEEEREEHEEEEEIERQEENEVRQGENEEEGQEENKVQQDEDKEECQEENAIQQVVFNKAEHGELEKLTKSLCINLLNETYQHYASQSLPEEDFNDIKSKCADLRSHFSDYLTPIMYETINNLFDELKQFQFDSDTASITAYLDNEKNKETNKESEKYILLSIVSSVINNFNLWKKEEKLAENTYLRKFADIVDILFKKTNLFVKDGENVCEASKRMQIINEGDITFGRRLDLIVASEQDSRDIELCSLEFKKGDASYTTLLYQQSKNFRINACILNEIHLLTLEESISIAYLDFSGRNAYISQIFKMNDQYVAHEVGKVIIIKNLLEMEILRETMFNLFRWKRSLVSNSNVVSLANAYQCNRFALADISNTLGQSSRLSPLRDIKPAKIFMSPSSTGKRTRTVFEQGN
ncbi:TOR complex subunit lst8 [Mucor velutinosus]|uniref:TOR complex subunit lst8 n=1 Tax=Mucor velutinosus TaxID=708070 RepID=A0AAN7HKH2_9FUNG|nr:TOR complex subunit lst8 [Mucor velutinosus]